MSELAASQTTALLVEWAEGFRLEHAPEAVVERMKALVLDLLRVVAVGAPLLWSQAARRLALTLGAGRCPNAALRREDYESALASPEVRALLQTHTLRRRSRYRGRDEHRGSTLASRCVSPTRA